MQKDLFGNNEKEKVYISIELAKEIVGLEIYPNFITAKEEKELINSIDNSPWLNDLKRRVQHYGYKYDYRARKIDNSLYLGALPSWSEIIIQKMLDDKIINFTPDQAIVNEYKIGLFLEPRTLLVMKKESRYDWYHGIPQRKSDKFNGEIIKRTKRVSITYRKVIIE